MNVHLLFALAITAFLFISCEKEEDTVGAQLLLNTDMESGNIQPSEWWNHENGNEPDLDWTINETDWTINESFSPSRSLRITKDSSDTSTAWGFWAQSYDGDMPYGKDLRLSVKIKGNNLQGQGISIAIRGDRGEGQNFNPQFATTQGEAIIDGTFDWTTHTVKLDTLHQDVYVINIYLIYLPETTGEVYFDDATLVVE